MGSPIVSVSREKDVTKNGQWKVLLYLCKAKKASPKMVNGQSYRIKRKRRHQEWSMDSSVLPVSREKDVTKKYQQARTFIGSHYSTRILREGRNQSLTNGKSRLTERQERCKEIKTSPRLSAQRFLLHLSVPLTWTHEYC